MARIRFSSVLALALPLTCLLSTSCADDQEYLLIDHAIWWSDDCTLDADGAIVDGQIGDVALGLPFGVGLSIENNLVQNGGSNTNLDDTEIKLERATVSLSLLGDDGSIDSLAASNPGLFSFETPIQSLSLRGGEARPVVVNIPASTVDALASVVPVDGSQTLIISTQIIGEHQSHKIGTVESREFTTTMNLCNGCLATTCSGEGIVPGACGYGIGCSETTAP